jgi:NADH-quinone oxidoreductase subunit E
MTHYLLELAIWLLAAFFVGCVIGTLLRRLFGKPVVAAAADGAEAQSIDTPHAAEPLPGHAPMAPRWSIQPEEEESAASEADLQPQSAAAAVASLAEQPDSAPRMPVGISGPRNGRPDALQRISGVGPRNEQILHSLGFYHFDQIAQWTEQHVDWIDGYMRFNGRIRRENWVEQCRLLAAGDEDEFFRLYGTGGMRGADGQSFAGDRTRHS